MLRNLCLDLARQDGQDRKKQRENHQVTKIPKTKRQKYGTNKTIELKLLPITDLDIGLVYTCSSLISLKLLNPIPV